MEYRVYDANCTIKDTGIVSQGKKIFLFLKLLHAAFCDNSTSKTNKKNNVIKEAPFQFIAGTKK